MLQHPKRGKKSEPHQVRCTLAWGAWRHNFHHAKRSFNLFHWKLVYRNSGAVSHDAKRNPTFCLSRCWMDVVAWNSPKPWQDMTGTDPFTDPPTSSQDVLRSPVKMQFGKHGGTMVVLPNGRHLSRCVFWSKSHEIGKLIQLMQVPVHWFGAAACYPTCQVGVCLCFLLLFGWLSLPHLSTPLVYMPFRATLWRKASFDNSPYNSFLLLQPNPSRSESHEWLLKVKFIKALIHSSIAALAKWLMAAFAKGRGKSRRSKRSLPRGGWVRVMVMVVFLVLVVVVVVVVVAVVVVAVVQKKRSNIKTIETQKHSFFQKQA